MQDLETGSSLDPDELIADDGVDLGEVVSGGEEGSDSLNEHIGPGGERGPVVGD